MRAVEFVRFLLYKEGLLSDSEHNNEVRADG